MESTASEAHMHGSYDDIPYFNPLECLLFYETVANNRTHRLPESFMINARTTSFFADEGGAMHSALVLHAPAPRRETRGKAKAARGDARPEVPPLPSFASSHMDSVTRLKRPSGRPFITIMPRDTREASDAAMSGATFVELTVEGVCTLWTSMLAHIHGASRTASCTMALTNIDAALAVRRAECGILLSVALAGVASILRFYADKEGDYEESLETMEIIITYLDTTRGARTGDELHVYLENQLRLAVRHAAAVGSADDDSATSVAEHYVRELQSKNEWIDTASREEWLDTLRDLALEAHEDLCDAESSEDEDGARGIGGHLTPSPLQAPGHCLASPVILVIAPERDVIRQTLTSCLLDVYSSVPVRVTTEATWSLPDFADAATPIFFLCSAHWVHDQGATPQEERLLDRMKVRRVFHLGCTEMGELLEDEVLSSVAVVRHLTRGARRFARRCCVTSRWPRRSAAVARARRRRSPTAIISSR